MKQPNNILILAAAGSGKTTYIVKQALNIKNQKVLITTYTIQNKREIEKKFIEIKGCIPANITIQTWFSFLLQHGVKPYKNSLYRGNIEGFCFTNNIPNNYVKKNDVERYFFTKNHLIYSLRLSEFAFECNKKSNNLVMDRISKIYNYIFIDEAQDLAGYDFLFIEELMKETNMTLVGDLRQRTYKTTNQTKNKSFNIKSYFEQEDKKINIEINTTILQKNYRSCAYICSFSDRIYPDYPKTEPNTLIKNNHMGIFLIQEEDLEKYLESFNSIQLIWNKKTKTNKKYKTINFGNSKGLTFDRVVVYPTKEIVKWLKNNQSDLAKEARAKFYVAVTRARYSVAFVLNNKDIESIKDIPIWGKNNE